MAEHKVEQYEWNEAEAILIEGHDVTDEEARRLWGEAYPYETEGLRVDRDWFHKRPGLPSEDFDVVVTRAKSRSERGAFAATLVGDSL